MGLIHVSCLKEWVNSKRLVYKGKKVQSFFWKALECELCQEPFENKMKFMMFQIMKFETPNNGNNYMILESIKSAPAKVVHVFDLQGCDPILKPDDAEFAATNEFRVGRSVDTDMKIADISVSRIHSYIRVVGDEIIVDDNGSKFGTLVKITKPIPLLSIFDRTGEDLRSTKLNSAIYQVGRTMFYFRLLNLQSEIVPLEQDENFKFKTIDPNDINLSYVAFKGTTFWRKTMLFNKI